MVAGATCRPRCPAADARRQPAGSESHASWGDLNACTADIYPLIHNFIYDTASTRHVSPVAACSVLGVLAALAVAGVGQEADAATTTIKGTDVHWEFFDSKWNYYSWSMPVVTYENTVVKSRDLVRDKINLQLDDSTIRTVNFDGFVRMDFAKVIDSIYDNSYDNSDFIWEVWHIVSQLTV